MPSRFLPCDFQCSATSFLPSLYFFITHKCFVCSSVLATSTFSMFSFSNTEC
jgi:hypothetical protein